MQFVRAIAVIVSLLHLPIVVAQGTEFTRQSVASTNADASWRPSPQQMAAVEATTKAYFAARDADKSSEAYALLSPRQKQEIPALVFAKMLEDFNARAGAVLARRLLAVTWYKDAQQSAPGLFAAVDYSSDYANLALHCGFLIWQEQPDGTFLQLREEVNIIDKAVMEKLRPSDVEKIRAQFRC